MSKVKKRFQKEKKDDLNDDNIDEMQQLIEKIENKNLSEYV